MTLLGQKSSVFSSASERYKDVPKQGRIEALRPYISKYSCFPEGSDPSTSPIRIEELKLLVRHWNLHHERSFWRNHTSKDEIVMALYQKLKSHQAQSLHVKTAKKQVRQRLDGQPSTDSPRHSKDVANHDTSEHNESDVGTSDIPAYDNDSVDDNHDYNNNNNINQPPHSPTTTTANFITSLTSPAPPPLNQTYTKNLFKRPKKNLRLKDFNSTLNGNINGTGGEGDCYLHALSAEGLLVMSRCDVSKRIVDPRFGRVVYDDSRSTSPNDSSVGAVDVVAGGSVNGNGGGGGVVVKESKGYRRDEVDRIMADILFDDSGGEEGGEEKEGKIDATRAAPKKSKDGKKSKDNDSSELLTSSPQHHNQHNNNNQQQQQQQQETQTQKNVKRKCASALLNMSLNEQMESNFITDGGLKSLLDLTSGTSDPETLLYCVGALLNLAGETRSGSRFICDFGVIQRLGTVIENHVDERIKYYSITALSVLTLLEDSEDRLISLGILPPLTKILTSQSCTTNPLTRIIALKALVNLTHMLSGSSLDNVNKHIIDQLRKLCLIDHVEVTVFTAEVISNLSCLNACRVKIAEEGVIEIINTLLRHKPNLKTIKACAISLCNLSQLKICRKDIVGLGVIDVITDMLLAGNSSEDVVYLCVLVLSNLTAQDDLRVIISKKGAIGVLCKLLSSEHLKTCAVAAKSLANFATDKKCRNDVISNGAVLPMILLLSSESEGPRSDALTALTNLVCFEDTFKVVLDGGFVPALDRMMSPDHEHAEDMCMHLEGISLALFNITTHPSHLPLLVEQNGADMLTSLLLNPDLKHLHTRTLSSIANTAACSDTHKALLKAGIVQALWSPIQASIPKKKPTAVLDVGTSNKIAEVLCRLTTTEESCKHLIDDGAVLSLVQLSRQDTDYTKLCVSTAYSNLSLKKPLTDTGFLTSLIDLANTHDNLRAVNCALTFCNLSTYPRGRAMLGKEVQNVCKALSIMMRSGCIDAEKIQRFSAIALCNALSVWIKPGDIEGMVGSGLVQDLIVITVLRVNVDNVKENLSRALFNLLIAGGTRLLMVEQGVMSSLIRLVKQVDTYAIKRLCVNALMNLSSEKDIEGAYMDKMLEMNAIHVIVTQASLPMAHNDVKIMCAATLANLARFKMTHKCILKEQVVAAFWKVCSMKHSEEHVERCAEVLYALSHDMTNHEVLVEQKVVPCIVMMIENGNASTRVLSSCTLCNLSKSPYAYPQLTDVNAIKCCTSTIKHVHMAFATRMNALRTICNVVVDYELSRKVCFEAGVVECLGVILKVILDHGSSSAGTSSKSDANGDATASDNDNEEELIVLTKTLRYLTEHTPGHPAFHQAKGMHILLRLSKLENATIKADVSSALLNLSCAENEGTRCGFIEDGIVEAVFWLTLQDLLGLTTSVYERCSAVLRNLSVSSVTLKRLVNENKTMTILKKMSVYNDGRVKYNACVTLYNVSCHRDTRDFFVRNGIIETIATLAEDDDGGGENEGRVRCICSAALHQYNQDHLRDPRIISILMRLMTMDATILDDCETTLYNTVTFIKSKLLKGWFVADGEGESVRCKYTHTKNEVSWLNIVVEQIMPFIPCHAPRDVATHGGDGSVHDLNSSIHNKSSASNNSNNTPSSSSSAAASAKTVGTYTKMQVLTSSTKVHAVDLQKSASSLPGDGMSMVGRLEMVSKKESLEELSERLEGEKEEEDERERERVGLGELEVNARVGDEGEDGVEDDNDKRINEVYVPLLPSLNTPASNDLQAGSQPGSQPGTGSVSGSNNNPPLELLTNDVHAKNRVVMDTKTLRTSFSTNVSYTMPVIPGSGASNNSNANTNSSPNNSRMHATLDGGGSVNRSERKEVSGGVRNSVHVARGKKGQKLEEDYKEMLMLKSRNLF